MVIKVRHSWGMWILCAGGSRLFESAEVIVPKIIRMMAREPFDEDKLRRGIQHALEKRPVSSDDVRKQLVALFINYEQQVGVM